MSNEINLRKYLPGNFSFAQNAKPSTGNIFTTPFKTINNSSNGTAGAIVPSSMIRILSYLLAIVIVVLVILLFIHFFIKPIFRLHPGGPGIIPVPGFDDGTLYWNKTNPGQILNKKLPIDAQYYNYSMNLDIFVENPLQFSSYPRIFLSRGATLKDHPSGDTMLGVLDNYNLVAGLLPDTNDLIVSVLNKDNNMENIIVPNIPIQEPFRLGIILMESALEVYINGHLMKTRTFTVPPKDVKGDIYPATGINTNVAKVRNLKIWKRILTTAEIRYATPALSKASDFNPAPISSVSSAGCPASKAVEDRISKLSADTVSDINSKLL